MILRKERIRGADVTFHKGYNAYLVKNWSSTGEDGVLIIFLKSDERKTMDKFIANTHVYMYDVPDDFREKNYPKWIQDTIDDMNGISLEYRVKPEIEG